MKKIQIIALQLVLFLFHKPELL